MFTRWSRWQFRAPRRPPWRRIFPLVVAGAVVFAVPAYSRPAGAPPSGAAPPNAARAGTGAPDYMKFIHVNRARFDPLAGTPALPPALRSVGRPPEAVRYFIVQFNDRVTRQMKQDLASAGTTILHYLSYNAFIVRADGAALQRAAALPSVRWTGPFEPGYKLSDRLDLGFDRVLNEAVERYRGRAGARGDFGPPIDTSEQVPVLVVAMERPGLRDIELAVRRLGGSVTSVSDRERATLAAWLPRASLEGLAREDAVLFIDRQEPAFVVNDVARWTIQSGDPVTHAAPVHDHLIFGTGQTVTVADTGLSYSHDAFSDPLHPQAGPDHRKVTAYYTPPGGAIGDGSDEGEFLHGTHVGGSVAGDAGTVHAYDGTFDGSTGSLGPHDGQAFDAKLQIQDLSTDGSSIHPSKDYRDMFQAALDRGSFVHTNSWASLSGPAYTTNQMETDDFVWSHPEFTVLFAAGNAGPELCTVSPQASAKNIISVGASANGVHADDLAFADDRYFSSRGPTADGRLKPDLMAPGESIWSAFLFRPDCPPFPCRPYRSRYQQLSGTSMAAPATAGSVALIRQYFTDGWYPSGTPKAADGFTPSAALLKAMLINGAVEMSGAEAHAHFQDFYPNMNQGWGRILLDNVLYFQGDVRALVIDDTKGGLATRDIATYTFTVTDITQPLRVVLAWSDYPGMPDGTSGCDKGVAPALVNNLDLRVIAPDGTIHLGNEPGYGLYGSGGPVGEEGTPDHINNVEGVIIPPAKVQAGVWTIEVEGDDVTIEAPDGGQPYALVITGR